jgi:NTP pyrophosphatase (non-canonical NTP hydrolase)
MMDSETNLQELKDRIKKFCEDRDWGQYHNPKDLSIGIITEASELLEHFRFKSEDQSSAFLDDEIKKKEISEELADILFFVMRLSQKYRIDLSDSLEEKLKKNEERYPVEKSKGSNKKYTELR